MSVLLKLKYLLPGHRKALEQDMREELESIASLSEADGKRSDLGSLTLAAEEGRSVWAWTWLDRLSADIRYACRTMRRNPGFTLTAVLSLALGIGANTAIFSLMNAILLKTLPVNDPATLVVLTSYSRDGKIGDFGYGDYLAIREEESASRASWQLRHWPQWLPELAPKQIPCSARSCRATIFQCFKFDAPSDERSGMTRRTSRSP